MDKVEKEEMSKFDYSDDVKSRLDLLGVSNTLKSVSFLWVAIAAFFSNILGLSTSLFIMVVYDRILPNQASSSLYGLALGVCIAIFFDILLKRSRARILESSMVTTDKKINQVVFDQYIETLGKGENKSIGELANINRDVEIFREFMSAALILTLIDIPFALLFVGVIYAVAGPIFIIPLVCIPLICILILAIQPFLSKTTVLVSQTSQTRHSLLVEILMGLKELQVSGAFNLMRKKFQDKSHEYVKASQSSKSLSQINENIIYAIQQLSQVAVIVYGFHLFINQDITMGAIIAAVILSGRTLAPLAKVGQTLGRANSALVARRNLKEFFLIENSFNKAIDREKGSNNGSVEITNGTMRFERREKPFFHNFNLEVASGQRIAIVGRNGAGKTSLINILLGLAKLETGNVSIGKRDIETISRNDIFKYVGVVFQDPWLFSGTLKENVGLGHEGCTDERIQQVISSITNIFGARQEDIDLNFQISDQGRNLSGGQKQIVALARALVPDPSILILDEPTSSMDVESEQRIVNFLKQRQKEKTLLIITHKVPLVSICERVIILDNGKIVWDNTRDKYFQLMQKDNKE